MIVALESVVLTTRQLHSDRETGRDHAEDQHQAQSLSAPAHQK
jgi:hypothetical protein